MQQVLLSMDLIPEGLFVCNRGWNPESERMKEATRGEAST